MDCDSIDHAACRFAHRCGYGAHPPLTQERLSALPDGKLAYRMKRSIGDGREVLILEPLQLPAVSPRHAGAAAESPPRSIPLRVGRGDGDLPDGRARCGKLRN